MVNELPTSIWFAQYSRSHFAVEQPPISSLSLLSYAATSVATRFACVFASKKFGSFNRFTKSSVPSFKFFVVVCKSFKKSKTVRPRSRSWSNSRPELPSIDTTLHWSTFWRICLARSTLPPESPEDNKSRTILSVFAMVLVRSASVSSGVASLRLCACVSLEFKFNWVQSFLSSVSELLLSCVSIWEFLMSSDLVPCTSVSFDSEPIFFSWLKQFLEERRDVYSSKVISTNPFMLLFDVESFPQMIENRWLDEFQKFDTIPGS